MFGLLLVKIGGESMDPVLPDGSHILFRPVADKGRNMRLGDIVLVDHPKLGRIVKLVAYLGGGGFELEGVSPQSISRAKMGRLPYRSVRGKMAMAYLSGGRWLSPETLPRAMKDSQRPR